MSHLKIVGGPNPFNIRLLDSETGQELNKTLAIQAMTLSIDANDQAIPHVEARLSIVELDLEIGAVQWHTKHPYGGYAPIAAIEFQDGTRVEFPADGTPVVKNEQ